jgi:hypothetical protein
MAFGIQAKKKNFSIKKKISKIALMKMMKNIRPFLNGILIN